MLHKRFTPFVLALIFTVTPLLTSAQSISDLQAQIQALLQQLAALQQTGGSTQTTAGTTNTTTACPNLTRNLYKGLKGNDIIELQRFLKQTGDFTYPEFTTYFGSVTEAAVKKFQCREMGICSGSAELNGYGVVGPRTREAIGGACSIERRTSVYVPTVVIPISASSSTSGATPAPGGVSTPVSAPTPGEPSPLPPLEPQPIPNGFALLDIHRSTGNCSETGYYGPFPDKPCTNDRRILPYNQNPVPVYRVSVNAKAGDVLRVSGQVTTTNDGNAEALEQEKALTCAPIVGTAPTYDPITNNLDPRFVFETNNACYQAQYDAQRPAWLNVSSTDMVSPRGTRFVPDQSTAVAQLVINGALVGARVYQDHAIDWTRERACDYPGQNCRGHMTSPLSGAYTVPADGTYTVELQVAEITGSSLLRQFTVEAGGGQLIVEQYRKGDSGGYGLAEAATTREQRITSYGPASCPGRDDDTVRHQPEKHTLFALVSNTNQRDLLRTFASTVALSSVYTDTDAMAFGLYHTGSDGDMIFGKAWGLYGTSVYYPYTMLFNEDFLRPGAGEVTYRATLHSSDTPIDFDCNATAGSGTAYGGKPQPDTGGMSLMRFTSRDADSQLLQSVAVRKGDDFVSAVTANGVWQTLTRVPLSAPQGGTIRADATVLLRSSALGGVTCLSRIVAGEYRGGNSMNAGYNPGDNILLKTYMIENVRNGFSGEVRVEVQCSAADGSTPTLQTVLDGEQLTVELFAR